LICLRKIDGVPGVYFILTLFAIIILHFIDSCGKISGTIYKCVGSPYCAGGAVFGSGPYSSESSLCSAAVHANAISKESGGEFHVLQLAGKKSYKGSTKNGIKSLNGKETLSSFAVFPLNTDEETIKQYGINENALKKRTKKVKPSNKLKEQDALKQRNFSNCIINSEQIKLESYFPHLSPIAHFPPQNRQSAPGGQGLSTKDGTMRSVSLLRA
jgi:hypothetical protein